ncbi:EthD family reductase [Kitasatospora sp. LaBMicrA B282]|uniref:EthD family reductase n=1 Tax=Kitasatospora sp. LaBMicrA B282 TaxID=3420949 RepID=UPI003D0F721D
MTARLIVVYEAPSDPEAFDRHYNEVHLPLAHRLPGLRSYTVGRDAVALRDNRPFHLIAELTWDSMADLKVAFDSPEGLAAAEDAAELRKYATTRSMIYEAAETVPPVG